ncbi:OmpA family protein [Sulfitobacter sp. SK012]|uniref:OmpA family protein n=1 Tax=Sulfitobacter sp. SK012 TaxID=1389005 RepID=UPI0020C7A0C7|nr:OmpA family protein [Sulfitobacter sp. SK012]
MNSTLAKKRTQFALIAVLTASGCATSSDGLYTQFFSEAGAITNTDAADSSNLNNRLVQTGERDVTFNLAKRFEGEVSPMINFAFNSSQLDAGAQATLLEQVNWIKQFPEIRFRVYGHTDAVGSTRANKALGLRRARAVVKFFNQQGISSSRLEAVASFGETQPVVLTQQPERANRRTVTQVSGFVERHPTVLDGKYAQVIGREYIASATAVSEVGDDALTAIGN